MDDTNGTDIVDIFEDLDTDLIEIFNRGQQAALFHAVPVEHHDATINRLNRVLERNLAHERSSNRNKSVYLIWPYKYIALPCVNYRLLWRRSKPTITYYFMKTLQHTVNILLYLLRIISLYVALENNVKFVLSGVFSVANRYSFSDNFLMDMITYIFSDDDTALRLRNLRDDGITFFFIVSGSGWSRWSWDSIQQKGYNLISGFIRTKEKHIDRNLLIFKFSNAISEAFPFLNVSSTGFSWLKFITLLVYLIYVVGGNILALNVIFLFTVERVRYLYGYLNIMKAFVKIVASEVPQLM